GLGLAACFELLHLLNPTQRPYSWLCYPLVAGPPLAHRGPPAPALARAGGPVPRPRGRGGRRGAAGVLGGGGGVLRAARGARGAAVVRRAVTVWAIGYLAVLPSFFAQLRWLGPTIDHGTVALALAVFVPKGCDIGAYTAGRLFGRHRMTPVLSPKKTWEGA